VKTEQKQEFKEAAPKLDKSEKKTEWPTAEYDSRVKGFNLKQ